MADVAYVDGRYLPVAQAGVSVTDRGFQFGDSVYEVIAFLNRRLVDREKHLWRLRRSLAALFITGVPTDAALLAIARRLIANSRHHDGTLYIQVSRGAAPRDHGFPAGSQPTLVLIARRFDFRRRVAQLNTGLSAITLPDQRWARCDIKTTNLLPAVLAKQEAHKAGADEAILHADGVIHEGSSANILMVDTAGRIVTHPISSRILAGVTRDTLIEQARAVGMPVVERPFTVAEAQGAAELLLTSTSSVLLPIVRLDGQAVGSGAPGPVARRLAQLMWADIARQTGWQADLAG